MKHVMRALSGHETGVGWGRAKLGACTPWP